MAGSTLVGDDTCTGARRLVRGKRCGPQFSLGRALGAGGGSCCLATRSPTTGDEPVGKPRELPPIHEQRLDKVRASYSHLCPAMHAVLGTGVARRDELRRGPARNAQAGESGARPVRRRARRGAAEDLRGCSTTARGCSAPVRRPVGARRRRAGAAHPLRAWAVVRRARRAAGWAPVPARRAPLRRPRRFLMPNERSRRKLIVCGMKLWDGRLRNGLRH
jgi:hypothetical protein